MVLDTLHTSLVRLTQELWQLRVEGGVIVCWLPSSLMVLALLPPYDAVEQRGLLLNHRHLASSVQFFYIGYSFFLPRVLDSIKSS